MTERACVCVCVRKVYSWLIPQMAEHNVRNLPSPPVGPSSPIPVDPHPRPPLTLILLGLHSNSLWLQRLGCSTYGLISKRIIFLKPWSKVIFQLFFQNKTMYSNQDTPTYRMGKVKVLFNCCDTITFFDVATWNLNYTRTALWEFFSNFCFKKTSNQKNLQEG